MKYINTVVIIASLLCINAAHATTWYVHPDSAMNCIQDCLDSCSTGDTVLVGPGVYSEHIVWPSTQGIDLVSQYGVDTTYIDGDTTDRVISITIAVDTTTTISGFTIQHGNTDLGAGIYCGPGSSPLITNNRISSNTAYGDGGGGIFTYAASPVIINNTIENNIASSVAGGGILCVYNSNPTIANNTITNNTCAAGGGGILIYVDCAPTIADNTVTKNTAGGGGGLCLQTTSSLVTGNTISGNTADFGGGIHCTVDDSSTITGNSITGNIAYSFAGGISCKLGASPLIDHCTIANNSDDGIYCHENANPVIKHNDIIDNTGYGVCNISPSVTVDADSNWWGDATGPYHPTANPGGLGDTVSDYVDFDPWLLDPVFPGIEEHEASKSISVFLQVSPNPFTHRTNIRYTIQDAGYTIQDMTLGIYDAAGRLVKSFRIT
ncbi:MAG: right-handed parallel beta-helix repeat-containing protein, partial [candidate division WOR-3 bacterium]